MTRNRLLGGIDLAWIMIFLYVTSVVLFSYNTSTVIYTKIAGVCLLCSMLFMRKGLSRIDFNIISHLSPLLLWYILCTFGVVYARNTDAVSSQLITLFQLLVITIAIGVVCIKKLDLNPIMLGFIFSSSVAVLLNVMFPNVYSVLGRWVGTLGNANIFGVTLMFSLAFCAYYFLRVKSYLLKIFICADVGLLFYALLNTGSRKAIIGFGIFSLVLSASILKKQWKKKSINGVVVLILLATSIGAGSYYVVNSKYYFRIENVINVFAYDDKKVSDGSIENRMLLYEIALNQISREPILGIGLSNFSGTNLNQMGLNVGTYSHSNIMEVTVSTGILGSLIFYSFHFLIFVSFLQS